jgi:hypothetical protein
VAEKNHHHRVHETKRVTDCELASRDVMEFVHFGDASVAARRRRHPSVVRLQIQHRVQMLTFKKQI